MLYRTNALEGYDIQATDGQIGELVEFYFDDGSWKIRYLIVDVGSWLKHKQILLIPKVVNEIDPAHDSIKVALTKQEIENSPDALEQLPVSRQMEVALHEHYDWSPYWDIDPMRTAAYGRRPSTTDTPVDEVRVDMSQEALTFATSEKQIHTAEIPTRAELRPSGQLRSSLEVSGYHLQAVDGEIGHIADFLADSALTDVNYLVIDTRNWLPGKKVIIPPTFIRHIQWEENKVWVALTKEQIKNAPEYEENDDPLMLDDFESQLQEYYAGKAVHET